MLYRVTRRIVTFADYEVEAESPAQAEEIIDEGTVDPSDEDVNEEATIRVERFENGEWVTEGNDDAAIDNDATGCTCVGEHDGRCAYASEENKGENDDVQAQ